MRIFAFVLQFFKDDDVSQNDIEMNKICSEHIASQVDLQWNVSQSNRYGRASLNGLSLTFRMLDIVRTSPIDWGL